MKTYRVKIIYKGWPPTYEVVSEADLPSLLEEASLSGVSAEVLGEVQWQSQLAKMEDPSL